MAFSREKSIVRFETRVNYIDSTIPPSPAITRTSTKFLGTRTSSLSLHAKNHRTHQYVPRLHRQTTEIPEATPLGSALQQFVHTCLQDELSITEKASALDELKCIMGNAAKALSRNLLGLQFLPPVFALGFSHWQTHPEKRVVCYLPVRVPKVDTYPITSDKVLLQLPRHLPPGMNIGLKDLEGFQFGYKKFISSEKLYSLVVKILKRTLIMKSVEPENINFSPSQNRMEITLQENEGWIGEIVPCVSPGPSSSVLYCCKPFYTAPVSAISPIDLTQMEEEESIRNSSVHIKTLLPSEVARSFSKFSSMKSSRRDSQNTLGSMTNMTLLEENSVDGDDVSTSLFGSVDNINIMNSVQEVRGVSRAESNTTNNVDCFDARTEGLPLGASSRPATDHYQTQTPDNEAHKDHPSNMTTAESTFVVMENLSDIHWYPCSPSSENNVIGAVCKTDGGVTATAMMIVCKLSQHDWRLVSLRCYDVQTAMFHDVDSRLDRCPRWQRDSLQHCVRSILSTLHTFATRHARRSRSENESRNRSDGGKQDHNKLHQHHPHQQQQKSLSQFTRSENESSSSRQMMSESRSMIEGKQDQNTLQRHHQQHQQQKGLPHFIVENVNLWSHWDEKQVKLAQGALHRLATNDTSLVSLLCRAGGFAMEDLT